MKPLKAGVWTSEWWALMVWMVKNAAVFLTIFLKMSPGDAASAQASLNQLIATVGLAAGEATALWKYIASRTELKKENPVEAPK